MLFCKRLKSMKCKVYFPDCFVDILMHVKVIVLFMKKAMETLQQALFDFIANTGRRFAASQVHSKTKQ